MSTHDRSTFAILSWLAAIGAGSAGELAATCGLSLRATRGRLRAMEEAGLSRSHRVLHGEPALHTLTRAGLRGGTPGARSGRGERVDFRPSAHGGARRRGARRARTPRWWRARTWAWERAEGRPVASAEVGLARDGRVALHRPDLVCWGGDAPIAIEVELTVKAPARLRPHRARLGPEPAGQRSSSVLRDAPAERALDCALRGERAEGRGRAPLEQQGGVPLRIRGCSPEAFGGRAAPGRRRPGWPPGRWWRGQRFRTCAGPPWLCQRSPVCAGRALGSEVEATCASCCSPIVDGDAPSRRRPRTR